MDEFLTDISKKTWVALDLETTGINPWKYEILEIGALKFNASDILDTYEVLIRPEKKQDPRSKAIHNISDDEILSNAISRKDALINLWDFIGDHPVIFHNASFDLAFLKINSDNLNINLPGNYYYDTQYLLRTYKPDLESYSLRYLQKYFEMEVTLHRALGDSTVTAEIFRWLLSENIEQLCSKKGYKQFFKYHRRISDFQILLPRNLEDIFSYFNKYIQSKTLMKVSDINLGNIRNYRVIIPQEIMIFNQNLMLKCTFYPGEQSTLIPLKNYIILDPDKGPIEIANM